MPSSATADNNYRQAVHKLVAACTFLKSHLPPDDEEDPELITPPNRPKPRTVNVACILCAAELENLEGDARDQHICTHQPGLHEGNRQDDEASETGSTGTRNKPTGKHRQPDAGVIRQDLVTLDDRFDTFTNALSIP